MQKIKNIIYFENTLLKLIFHYFDHLHMKLHLTLI